MNKLKPWEGLDNLIAWTLKETNIYLEATEDNKIKVHLQNDRPPNSSLACSIKEFIDNEWSIMEKKTMNEEKEIVTREYINGPRPETLLEKRLVNIEVRIKKLEINVRILVEKIGIKEFYDFYGSFNKKI